MIHQHPFGERRARLQELLKSADREAFVVNDLVNISYLTGFIGSYAVLVVDQESATLLTDARYTEIAAGQVQGLPILTQPLSGVDAFFESFFQQKAYKTTCFEPSLPFSKWEKLKKYLGKGAEGLQGDEISLTALRKVKDAGEVQLIQRAAVIADKMMSTAFLYATAGTTEADLSRRIRQAAEDLGGQGESFTNIVASGPNSSRPHHKPSDRALQPGDFLTVDLGAVYQGYCSDLTRNPVIGKASSQLETMYAVCLEAQQAGVKACRAGKTGKEVDSEVREIIERKGFGEYFVHGTGHGVGLEIHESPRLSQSSGDTLQAGNIVTVEPGIYIPGVGGVRIEDLLLVTDAEPLVLSHSPKNFTVLAQ